MGYSFQRLIGGYRMTFAEKLKELRAKKKMSQTEVADKINIQRGAYNAWEQGTSFPRVNKLPMLCKFYNVSADYLLGIETPNNPEPLKDDDLMLIEELAEKLTSDERKKLITIINTIF